MRNLNPASASVCTALLGLALLLSGQAAATQLCSDAITPSTPSSDFTVHGDGTVTHHKTGLMWMSDPLSFTDSWIEALEQAESAVFAGYSDWRLPNVKELGTIVETRCSDPAINLTVFPGTTGSSFWTSSPPAEQLFGPWLVDFQQGYIYEPDGSARHNVRLVRGGQ